MPLYLLLLVCQAAQLTNILEGQVRELAEEVERERALKDAAEATSKVRAKIAVTTEKKAATSEKAREEVFRFGGQTRGNWAEIS